MKVVIFAGTLLTLLLSCGQNTSAISGPDHQPITLELIDLLQQKPALKNALATSVKKAAVSGITTLEEYYNYVDSMVTLVPTKRNILPEILEFYYLLDLSPNRILQSNSAFQAWVFKFANDWGKFLDTPSSAASIGTFLNDPAYHIDDYYVSPSGWLTYNQFFARQVKPGKRPIDGENDKTIVVSPADAVFHGQWNIDDQNEITLKGIKSSISELLSNSQYADRFKGGVYTHSFLNVNDYHRFHTPVSGTVLEAKDIPGKLALSVYKKNDGTLDVTDGDDYQFTQARGLIILDSPVGLVAVLPIGMAQVSSVNITVDVGAKLRKGEEFGFFQFGGSDIVTIYEANSVKLNATVGTHYNQGKALGSSLK